MYLSVVRSLGPLIGCSVVEPKAPTIAAEIAPGDEGEHTSEMTTSISVKPASGRRFAERVEGQASGSSGSASRTGPTVRKRYTRFWIQRCVFGSSCGRCVSSGPCLP